MDILEDTDDWLGWPTPFETCRHQLSLYENEFEELNTQLREARERIYKLVGMHTSIAEECKILREQAASWEKEVADANRRATEAETRSTWELMAKNKEISHLYVRLRELDEKRPHRISSAD